MAALSGVFVPPDARCFGESRELASFYPLHAAVLSRCPGRLLELIEDSPSPEARIRMIVARDKENRTPLSLACELGGRRAYQCAQILIEYGAQVDEVDSVGFSPVSIAESLESPALVSLLEAHSSEEWTCSERRFCLRKLAAHIHGVVATSFPERPLGVAYLPQMHSFFLDHLEAFLRREGRIFTQEEREEIVKVMDDSPFFIGARDLQRHLRAGSPVPMIQNWDGHFFTVVFFRNFLIIGNRGEGVREGKTVEVFLIDPDRIDDRVLRDMWAMKLKPLSEGSSFFYFALPHRLGVRRVMSGEERALCASLKEIAPKPIREDTCCWAALKLSLRLLLACLFVIREEPSDYSLVAAHAKEWTKRFSTALRKGSLEACMASEGEARSPDARFLASIQESLGRRLEKYPSHEGARPLFLTEAP